MDKGTYYDYGISTDQNWLGGPKVKRRKYIFKGNRSSSVTFKLKCLPLMVTKITEKHNHLKNQKILLKNNKHIKSICYTRKSASNQLFDQLLSVFVWKWLKQNIYR